MKESEDTSGALRKAAFEAWGRAEKQLRETGLEVRRAGQGLSRRGARPGFPEGAGEAAGIRGAQEGSGSPHAFS